MIKMANWLKEFTDNTLGGMTKTASTEDKRLSEYLNKTGIKLSEKQEELVKKALSSGKESDIGKVVGTILMTEVDSATKDVYRNSGLIQKNTIPVVERSGFYAVGNLVTNFGNTKPNYDRKTNAQISNDFTSIVASVEKEENYILDSKEFEKLSEYIDKKKLKIKGNQTNKIRRAIHSWIKDQKNMKIGKRIKAQDQIQTSEMQMNSTVDANLLDSMKTSVPKQDEQEKNLRVKQTVYKKDKDPQKEEVQEMVKSEQELKKDMRKQEKDVDGNITQRAKKESDSSLKPPKKWWGEKTEKVKKDNPDYDSDQVDKTVGAIWSDLSDAKKDEIRGREGKEYGKAPKDDDKKKEAARLYDENPVGKFNFTIELDEGDNPDEIIKQLHSVGAGKLFTTDPSESYPNDINFYIYSTSLEEAKAIFMPVLESLGKEASLNKIADLFQEFREIATQGTPQESFEIVKTMKDIPFEVSEKFREQYDPEEKLTPLEAWANFVEETNMMQPQKEASLNKEAEVAIEDDNNPQESPERLEPSLIKQKIRPSFAPAPQKGEVIPNLVSETIQKELQDLEALESRIQEIDAQAKKESAKIQEKIQQLQLKMKQKQEPLQTEKSNLREDLAKLQESLKLDVISTIPMGEVRKFKDILVAHLDRYNQTDPAKIKSDEVLSRMIIDYGDKMEEKVNHVRDLLSYESKTVAETAAVYPETKQRQTLASFHKEAGVLDWIIEQFNNIVNLFAGSDEELNELDVALSEGIEDEGMAFASNNIVGEDVISKKDKSEGIITGSNNSVVRIKKEDESIVTITASRFDKEYSFGNGTTKIAKNGRPNDVNKCRDCAYFESGVGGAYYKCATCVHAFSEKEMKAMSKEDKKELSDYFTDRGGGKTVFKGTDSYDKKHASLKKKAELYSGYSDTYGGSVWTIYDDGEEIISYDDSEILKTLDLDEDEYILEPYADSDEIAIYRRGGGVDIDPDEVINIMDFHYKHQGRGAVAAVTPEDFSAMDDLVNQAKEYGWGKEEIEQQGLEQGMDARDISLVMHKLEEDMGYDNQGDVSEVKVYDNEGESFDRYTVLIGEDAYGMSENAMSPQGFNQFLGDVGAIAIEDLGRKIEENEIPSQIQEAIRDRIGKVEDIATEEITASGEVIDLDKKANGESGTHSYYEVEVDGKKEKVSPGQVAMNRNKYKDKKYKPSSMEPLI